MNEREHLKPVHSQEKEGFDESDEQHQVLVSRNNLEKQQKTIDYYCVPAANPILAKNSIDINKAKVLIREIEYYLQPEQLLSSNIHRQCFSQDKPHNGTSLKTKTKEIEELVGLWQKYFRSQKYNAVYLKYFKDDLEELKTKGYRRMKSQLYRLCRNNPTIFSTYLIDLSFLSEYGTSLLQNLSHQSYQQIMSKKTNDNITFDSKFQCGNLFAVFSMINPPKSDVSEFDLVLQCDINTKGYSNWFYFSMRVQKKGTIKLNIVNQQKSHSLFTSGMKPAVFSYKRKQYEKIQWHRDGYNFRYFPNELQKINNDRNVNFYTLSFYYDAKYDDDLIFIAANLPYSYTKMLKYVDHIEKITKLNTNIYFKKENIASTLSSNLCPVLTLTWKRNKKKIKVKKKIIGVIARQHPAETVSSYVMEGFINSLVVLNNQSAVELLQNYIFKIIPMVNIDGVIYGNSRCDLSGTDINRRWTRNPNKHMYPIISAIRTLFNRLKMDEYEFDYFIDLHGHSRQLGTFIYGCKTFDEMQYKELSWIMSKLNSKFIFQCCSFGLSSYKRQTARGIMSETALRKKALTLQTSFYGYKSGNTKHFDVKDLHKIGSTLIEAVYAASSKDPKIFNWQDLHSEMKEYLEAAKSKRKQKNYLNNNSDQSSDDADSDSQPEIDEMNEKQKSQYFLDATVANKIGLNQVKVLKKNSNADLRKEKKQEEEERLKKYERIVDGFNEKLDEFVLNKGQNDFENGSIQQNHQKLNKSKNFLIRETRSTTKIIPFRFSERSSKQKLEIKKSRKSVELLSTKPQKLSIPQIKPSNGKKNNFWSNMKKEYDTLLSEKKSLVLNRDTGARSKSYNNIITTRSKLISTQFL